MTESQKLNLSAASLSAARVSPLTDAAVHVTEDKTVAVEFSIQDLLRKLAPGGVNLTSCGGCNGCTGCSM